ncbi:ROK family protein [Paraflavisolibacter sp. H34]|uniref:ROK family protein n=1 Tax=Huijunlia imazamoxiresistens TaxID=3127457 RepID=UPI003015D863
MMRANTESESFALGVDVGSGHVSAAVVDLENNQIVPGTRRRSCVDALGPAEDILGAWGQTVGDALAQSPVPVDCLAIAMPGPFDYEGGVSHIRYLNKYDALYGFNVKEFFARRFSLPVDHIKMRNEAEAFLAGEVLCGAAAGFGNVVGIKLGAGLGSARCRHGRTEDAHLSTSQFLDGIAEDYLSTRWFVKRCGELAGGPVRNFGEVLERECGEPGVQRLFQVFSHNLAHFLGGVIQSEKPEVLLIGGCLADAYDRFFPQLSLLLEKHLDKLVIRRAVLGEDAALIGAASLWANKMRPCAALV